MYICLLLLYFFICDHRYRKSTKIMLGALYLNDRVQKLYALQWFTYFLLTVGK